MGTFIAAVLLLFELLNLCLEGTDFYYYFIIYQEKLKMGKKKRVSTMTGTFCNNCKA